MFFLKRTKPRGIGSDVLSRIAAYIDAHYSGQSRTVRQEAQMLSGESVCAQCCAPMPMDACTNDVAFSVADDLGELLENLDAGFSETLLMLMDRTGKKDSEIYKKANVDRKHFSKIRNNPHYKPSKATALAFAIALELDLAETEDLISRAGFTLSHSSKFDLIVEYFILQGNYDIFAINEALFAFDQSLLGA